MIRLRAPLHVLALLGGLFWGGQASGQQKVERSLHVNRDVGINVWIPAGTIRVIGWDRDSLHVEGTVATGDRFFFGGGPDGVKVGVEQPVTGPPAKPAHITIYLPRTGRASVRSVSASINATDIAGWFNTVSGEIRVSGRAEDVQAEAIDGSIVLTGTTPNARARTGSGTLTVGGAIEDLIASTVSGPLTVTANGLTRGRLESMTGAIVLDAPVDRASSIDIDNHNGSVELRLAASVSADFELTSVAGTISNYFDKRAPTAGRQGRGQELAFFTNPKGARVVVRTFKGPIILRQR